MRNSGVSRRENAKTHPLCSLKIESNMRRHAVDGIGALRRLTA